MQVGDKVITSLEQHAVVRRTSKGSQFVTIEMRVPVSKKRKIMVRSRVHVGSLRKEHS